MWFCEFVRSQAVAFFKRTGIIRAGSLGIVVLLGVRLFQLQAIEHQRYKRIAEGNRIRLVLEPAPRGNIYDRHGEIIAGN